MLFTNEISPCMSNKSMTVFGIIRSQMTNSTLLIIFGFLFKFRIIAHIEAWNSVRNFLCAVMWFFLIKLIKNTQRNINFFLGFEPEPCDSSPLTRVLSCWREIIHRCITWRVTLAYHFSNYLLRYDELTDKNQTSRNFISLCYDRNFSK